MESQDKQKRIEEIEVELTKLCNNYILGYELDNETSLAAFGKNYDLYLIILTLKVKFESAINELTKDIKRYRP